MKRNWLKFFVVIVATSVCANFVNASTSTLQYQPGTRGSVMGIQPFIGAGVGATQSSLGNRFEGVQGNLKLLGSFNTQTIPFVFDLGLGTGGQNFSQTRAGDDVRGGLAEVAARYRLEDNWQAGVAGNIYFDQGREYRARQADAHFVGIQALKEFALGQEWVARWGGRLMSGTNTNAAVNMALMDFQLTWGGSKPTAQKSSIAQKTTEAPKATSLQDIWARELLGARTGQFNFEVAKADLSAQDEKYLAQLSQSLKASRSFQKIQIVGHADQTGSNQLNLELSRKRAENVARILSANGISSDRISIQAEGSQKPITSSTDKEALSVNRRVEIRFIGVENQAELEKQLKNL